ncbi:enoyl-CoA hydratase/isomerase family protein [Gordonia sp. CPCC 205333]|uniref:enoyl-CoA hydratase/isomerase family protein n=1 Tax=Gordonia sp. CPCC 205333 TaxID=3140790 RepID=UPI003AF36B13
MSYIRSAVANGVGEIILDRPKALNALDQSMVEDIYEVLVAWGDDDSVRTVLVSSASDRAFCAGGDIRAIREAAVAGDHTAITDYFSAEYRLDQLIANYPKPYVTLIDGAAMGGGLGISVHGEIRVVTERALIAMPETAIGFFPDIGSTYFLPRLPEGVGNWLGLTGARVSGAQALQVGLATHAVHSDDLPDVATALRSGAPLIEALGGLSVPAADSLPLDKVAEYFVGDSAAGIVGGLRGAAGPDDGATEENWASQMLDLLHAASPTSLAVTTALIAAGAQSTLDECFDRELRAAQEITATPDFAEGVRAVLVDKDRRPAFVPATLDEVDAATVARIVGE